MQLSPSILFSFPSTNTAFEWTTLVSVVIAQAVASLLFYLGIREQRSKDHDARSNQIADEQQNFIVNLRRDILMEIMPALNQNYHALADFIDLRTDVDKITKRIRVQLEKSVIAIAKLQAVSSDELLNPHARCKR